MNTRQAIARSERVQSVVLRGTTSPIRGRGHLSGYRHVKRIRCWVFSSALALLLAGLTPLPLLAQTRRLALEQILNMLNSGVSDERIREVVTRTCVTDAFLLREKLIRAGASTVLIDLSSAHVCRGAAPITGKIVTVEMIGNEKGYRFEPATVTIRSGDGVRFVMVSGGPHNAAFDPSALAPDTRLQLDANIPEKIGELSSELKMNQYESVTISFGGIQPGIYGFYCTPHLAMGMKGYITVLRR